MELKLVSQHKLAYVVVFNFGRIATPYKNTPKSVKIFLANVSPFLRLYNLMYKRFHNKKSGRDRVMW